MLCLLAVPVLSANVLAGDAVQSYQVPKAIPVLTKPSVAAAAMTMPATAGTVAPSAKPLSWTTPKGWVEQPAGRMRIGQFSVPGSNGSKAELAITVFSGLVGDEISNINRWRGEIGLTPIPASEVTAETVAVGDAPAKFYQFTGSEKSTIVAWLIKDETSWFFKLRGDTVAVTEAKPALVEFLKSVRFVAPPAVDAGDAITSMTTINPHAVDSMSNLPAGHPTIDNPGQTVAALAPLVREPMWDTPASWQEQTASRMVLKSFQISNAKGKATASISTFPGEVGGVLANVNRWRGQLGLDPIQEADLAKSTEPVSAGDDKGTLLNAASQDGKTRLIAVYLPHGNSTWFYKLQGDGAQVEAEKTNLLNVIKSVRYP